MRTGRGTSTRSPGTAPETTLEPCLELTLTELENTHARFHPRERIEE